MSGVSDFKEVLERRKNSIGDPLKKSVCDSLYTGALANVCNELNVDSCCGRNWRGLACFLFEPSPDTNTIDMWSKHASPAYDMLCTWADNCDKETSFGALLEAMIASQSYSSADELLCYLESPTASLDIIVEQQDKEIEQDASRLKSQPTTKVTTHRKRSTSLVKRLQNCIEKRFRRSNSYPPDNIQTPVDVSSFAQPNRKKDEIFIVCSSQDNKTEPMKNLMSFVRRLQPVRTGNWRVETIHDLPGGQIATSWLTERVERAAYVIICCSKIIKQITDWGAEREFTHQSEYNLKFTVDFLINGRIYMDMCLNVGGRFLPILLPNNDLSCVFSLLACFKVFSWPEEFKGIRNYILGESERPVPKLGQKKQLIPLRTG